MTKEEVFTLFKRIQKHFNNTSFNFFTPSQKLYSKLKEGSSESSVCYVLSSLPKTEFLGLCVSHQIKDHKQLFDLVKPSAKEIYDEWKSRVDNKHHLFYKELQKFSTKNSIFTLETLSQEFYRSNLSLETLVGLYRCQLPWSIDHSDCIVSNLSRKILKYNPFLSFDLEKLQLIIKRLNLQEHFNETTTLSINP